MEWLFELAEEKWFPVIAWLALVASSINLVAGKICIGELFAFVGIGMLVIRHEVKRER